MGKHLLATSILILLGLTIIAISLTLPLYGQTPTPLKGSDKPKTQTKGQQTKNDNKVPNIDQSLSNTSPNHRMSGVSQHTNTPRTNDANNQDDKSTCEWWLIAFTGGLFVFTGGLVGVGIFQYKAMKRTLEAIKQATKIQSEDLRQSIAIAKETADVAKIQAETMQKELVLTQRPKLRVRDVAIPDLGNQTPGNNTPNGELHIVNVGGTPAMITNVGCWVEWLSGGLPMKKPYDEESPNCPNAVSTKLQAGESFSFKFFDDKKTWEHAWNDIFRGSIPLYVMGYVEYIDGIGTPRRTTFCREYTWPKGKVHELQRERRFFPVDDPDYEHED